MAVMADRAEAIDVSAQFREQLHRCMTRRADALFELVDALWCTGGPVPHSWSGAKVDYGFGVLVLLLSAAGNSR
ncbi:hypothetical protein GCM10010109_21780 [Actinoplanes campanulatus]|nr:hypothetical protein GCM10010109_21780 [Actinoplanes campanulatus]